ncbi:hypothetical protein [Laspinema olomoucense]|nr:MULTISPECIES: hypothetical protein [unclassified Laspinema]
MTTPTNSLSVSRKGQPDESWRIRRIGKAMMEIVPVSAWRL